MPEMPAPTTSTSTNSSAIASAPDSKDSSFADRPRPPRAAAHGKREARFLDINERAAAWDPRHDQKLVHQARSVIGDGSAPSSAARCNIARTVGAVINDPE